MQYQGAVESCMGRQLERVEHTGLRAAMGHLLGRGKLFRPLLALACAIVEGHNDPDECIPLVTPLEMIHTFTLIHDDLPCMDDALLRRGVSAVHVEHGEAQAVLAGDALQNFALACIVEEEGRTGTQARLQMLKEATWAIHRVVEGQMMDIEYEQADCTLEQLQQLHMNKTGALLAACCTTGALLAGSSMETVEKYRDFGLRLGLVFQIRDDLLSVVSTDEQMGKTLSTDEAKEKSTYPRILGLAEAQRMLEQEAELLRKNAAELPSTGDNLLEDIVEFTAVRNN